MDDDGLIAVGSIPELVGADVVLHPGGVGSVLADHQHKGFYYPNGLVWSAAVGGVQLQLPLCVFVTGDAVGQHQLVQRLVAKIIEVNVGAGHGEGGAGISVLNGLGQGILIHHILERNLLRSFGDERRGGKLQTQQRVEFVQGLGTLFRPIVVGLVHNEHQVRQAGKILIERAANELVHPPHVGLFLVKFVDVIDKNMDIRFKQGDGFFSVIVVCDDLGQGGETAQPFEHIFGAVVVAEIFFQLLIDGGVGGDNKKIPDVVLGIQIGDKGPHQPGFAYPSSQGEGQGEKLPLEIGADGIHSVDGAQGRIQIHILAQLHTVYDFLQDFERFLLRLAQGHDAADVVRGIQGKITPHRIPPRPHTPGDVRYSDCNPFCQTHSVPGASGEFF